LKIYFVIVFIIFLASASAGYF